MDPPLEIAITFREHKSFPRPAWDDAMEMINNTASQEEMAADGGAHVCEDFFLSWAKARVSRPVKMQCSGLPTAVEARLERHFDLWPRESVGTRDCIG